ncbi:MAG: ribose 5-phosphate isomerase B [Atopobiaceae bacterium]|jgi:ribose 5-phosphate isomerase B
MKTIAIGNDHAATDMKFELVKYLEDKGYTVINVGTDGHESMDYPVSGYKVAKLVQEGKADGGIAICGTGVGISLACNKLHGIRAAACSEPYSARMSRAHNNCNVICFGERVVGIETAKDIIDAWLNAEFEGGRHQRRVDMIMEIEATQHLKAADEA